MGELKNRLKPHIIYMAFLIIIILIFYRKFLSFSELTYASDIVPAWVGIFEVIKQSIVMGQVPLWSPQLFGGIPFLAITHIPIFYITTPLLFIFPTMSSFLNMTIILHLIAAAITMYILVYYLEKKPQIAFIAALIYVLNGQIAGRVQWGHLPYIYPYVFIPLIYLFVVKAFRSKEWVKYSVIAGILFAVMLHAGTTEVFLYTGVVFGCYLLFKLIGRNFWKRLTKAALVALIVVLVLLGLYAVELLPALEFVKYTNRQASYEYDQILQPLPLHQFFIVFGRADWKTINGSLTQELCAQIGIIALFFVFFALYKKYKNKKMLFYLAVIIILLLLAAKSPVSYFFWKYVPFFDMIRKMCRPIILVVFLFSIIAANGVSLLMDYLKEKRNFGAKKLNICFAVIAVLMLVDLGIFGYLMEETRPYEKQLTDNQILNYIANDKDLFRIHSHETSGTGSTLQPISVPLKLNILYGWLGEIWVPEYFNVYLSVAYRDAAKFYGMLNVKYVVSMDELNISGYEFVRKFDKCEICTIDKTKAQYLYRNREYLPRAYMADNAMFITGNMDTVKQTAYALMLDSNFNPASTVIVVGENGAISNYNLDFLKKFDVIVLTQDSVDANSEMLLKGYVGDGGMLIPNIVEGANTITEDDIAEMWQKLKTNRSYDNIDEIKVNYYSNNKVALDTKNREGFVVLSEQYFMYPGWNAYAGGSMKDVLRTDGIISAVYLDGNNDETAFVYEPKSYTTGLIITIITLLIVTGYFVYHHINGRKKGKKETETEKNE